MATYHLSAKIGQKGKAQAHAAYIAREGKYSEGKRYEDLEATGSGNMPKWAEHTPAEFWKAADDYERANGSAYREFEIALPRELTPEQRLNLVQEFIVQEIGDKHAYQFAIHTPKAALEKGEQPHAHIMYSERIRDGIERDPEQYFKRYNAKNPEKGGSKKFSGGKNPNELKVELLAQRERWAILQNKYLEKYGHTGRVTHLSLEEQGITDRQPEKHLGGSGVRNTNAKNKLLELRELTAENAQAQAEVQRVIESIKIEKRHDEVRRFFRPDKPASEVKQSSVIVEHLSKIEERQKEKVIASLPVVEEVKQLPEKPMNSVEKITRLELPLLFSEAEIAGIIEKQAKLATQKRQRVEVFNILISQYDWIKSSNKLSLLSKNVGGAKPDILNSSGDYSVSLRNDNEELALFGRFTKIAEIKIGSDTKLIAEEINNKAMDWAKQNAKDPATLITNKPKETTTVVSAKQDTTAPKTDNSIPPEVIVKYIQVDNKFCNRKNKEIVMFEDKTSKLETNLNSQAIVIDLVKIATERGWKAIKITGTPEFKREAWQEAETRGLKTIGYQPTDFEKAILDGRIGKGEAKPVPVQKVTTPPAPPAVEVKQPQQEISEQQEKRANEVFLQLSNQIRDHWREVESEKLFSEVRQMFDHSKELKKEEPRRLLGLNEKKWQAWADSWNDLKKRHDETRAEANLIKEGKSKQEQVIKPQFERAATKKLQELHPELYQTLVDKAAREQAQAEEQKRQQELQRNARAKEREQATQAARQRKRDIGVA